MSQENRGFYGDLVRDCEFGLGFPLTNETLDAIMTGLEPNANDKILAVAGCGDQAFALLEKAGIVVVSDINPAQLDLIRERKEALSSGDSLKFILPTDTDFELHGSIYRVNYFNDEKRLALIQKNLPNLIINGPKSLEDYAKEQMFTKIYASDAIGENYCKNSLEVHLVQVLKGLEKSGLLYVANGAEFNNMLPNISRFSINLVLELTKKARDVEKFYTPNVYLKI